MNKAVKHEFTPHKFVKREFTPLKRKLKDFKSSATKRSRLLSTHLLAKTDRRTDVDDDVANVTSEEILSTPERSYNVQHYVDNIFQGSLARST